MSTRTAPQAPVTQQPLNAMAVAIPTAIISVILTAFTVVYFTIGATPELASLSAMVETLSKPLAIPPDVRMGILLLVGSGCAQAIVAVCAIATPCRTTTLSALLTAVAAPVTLLLKGAFGFESVEGTLTSAPILLIGSWTALLLFLAARNLIVKPEQPTSPEA